MARFRCSLASWCRITCRLWWYGRIKSGSRIPIWRTLVFQTGNNHISAVNWRHDITKSETGRVLRRCSNCDKLKLSTVFLNQESCTTLPIMAPAWRRHTFGSGGGVPIRYYWQWRRQQNIGGTVMAAHMSSVKVDVKKLKGPSLCYKVVKTAWLYFH